MDTRATYPSSAVRSGLVSSKTCLVVKTNRAPRSGLVLSLFLANGPYRRGKVTRVNRTLKRTPEKFRQETCQPCLYRLPITLDSDLNSLFFSLLLT